MRLHRVNFYFREEGGQKNAESEYMFKNFFSVYIPLQQIVQQAVCKTLLAEAVRFFFCLISSSIHRNFAKQDSGANTYAAYGLKCWAVWGFIWAQGEEQHCFGSHT